MADQDIRGVSAGILLVIIGIAMIAQSDNLVKLFGIPFLVGGILVMIGAARI
jgi:hypothetical protein